MIWTTAQETTARIIIRTAARTTARITARTQAQIILTQLAATKVLINQATLITVAKMPITQVATKVLTAVLTLQTRVNKF